jgi:calcineurin-like phosphoesterase family protein
MVEKSQVDEYCPELDLEDGEAQRQLSTHPRGIYNRRQAEMRAVSRDRIARKTFVTSDQHLGHYKIIEYCSRPFETLDEMNETLIQNWNNTIRNSDKVYFLGDLAFGKAHTTDYWLDQLNGEILFFRGNHDTSPNIDFFTSGKVTLGGVNFYLVHDPLAVDYGWKGWILHGHHHNNHPYDYPYIHSENKTINVSVELTEYKPVNVSTILSDISSHKNYASVGNLMNASFLGTY